MDVGVVYCCTDCGAETEVNKDKRCQNCGSGRVILKTVSPRPAPPKDAN